MKIGIVTASYDRQPILRLWCASINRLNDTFGDITAVVTSSDNDFDICYKYGVNHIAFNRNKPVSRKFNMSMQYMADKGMDYVMVLGSDDIMSNDMFQTILTEAEENNPDVIGTKEIYFYSLTRGANLGKLIKTSHKRILGVAKTIRADVLDKVNYTSWHMDRNKGLDADLSNIIRPHVITTSLVDGMVVDVKTALNMNSFGFWNNKPNEEVKEEIFLNGLSQEERDIINDIKEKL